jgi:AcrR family transcriptional regulator
MTIRTRRIKSGNGTQRQGSRHTQRARLLEGMIATANSHGYAGASVSRVIAHARVSRPTFYEYFVDRDDCFLRALVDVHERLLARIAAAIEMHPAERALQCCVEAIVEFARTDPAAALFLSSQAMAGSPAALGVRDRAIAEIERAVDAAHARATPTALIPDISPRVAIGGIYRLLGPRLRRVELGLTRTLEDLSCWIDSYLQPAEEQRWRTLQGMPVRSRRPVRTLGPLPRPNPLAPGRPGPSSDEVAASHRERILFAAAQLAEQKGYNATTVADITCLAGIDGRAFYAAFADKQDAFMAVHEIGVQQVMNAIASAYFAATGWPERIWQAGAAFTEFLQNDPMVAHVGFVEAYAVGPAAVQRVEDSHVTFTIFLQEGYALKPRRLPPSRMALEAIITAIFEIVYLQSRARKASRLTGMLGHVEFTALAPFMGADEANQFIGEQLMVEKRVRAGSP